MPYENLNDRLRLLHNDKLIPELIRFIEDNYLVNVYIEHKGNVVVKSLPCLAYKGGNGSVIDVIDLDRDHFNGFSGDRNVAYVELVLNGKICVNEAVVVGDKCANVGGNNYGVVENKVAYENELAKETNH